jgi:hypothetical protein
MPSSIDLKHGEKLLEGCEGGTTNGLSVRGLSLRLYHAKNEGAVNSETFPTAHEWLRWHLSGQGKF